MQDTVYISETFPHPTYSCARLYGVLKIWGEHPTVEFPWVNHPNVNETAHEPWKRQKITQGLYLCGLFILRNCKTFWHIIPQPWTDGATLVWRTLNCAPLVQRVAPGGGKKPQNRLQSNLSTGVCPAYTDMHNIMFLAQV